MLNDLVVVNVGKRQRELLETINNDYDGIMPSKYAYSVLAGGNNKLGKAYRGSAERLWKRGILKYACCSEGQYIPYNSADLSVNDQILLTTYRDKYKKAYQFYLISDKYYINAVLRKDTCYKELREWRKQHSV